MSAPEPRIPLEVIGVQVQDIEGVWPYVAKALKPAIQRSRGWFSLELVADRLLTGQYQLFVGVRDRKPAGAMVTELPILEASGRRVLLILLAAGSDPAEWADFLPAMEAWARSAGCEEIAFEGRRGWHKVVGPMGFQEVSRRFARPITPEPEPGGANG